MRQLAVNLAERSYNIYIEAGIYNRAELLASHCKGENVLILSNETIAPFYLDQLSRSLVGSKVYHFLIEDGEKFKSLENYSAILDYLINKGFRRNDTLIALGGGVVGDLGGFAAASYQRGMDLIQCPTSLLAQVDSSVGGKTAVNHPLGKNMIGAFYQPKAVFIDTDTLNTLPDREYYSGFAEVIKYAMLGTSEIKQLLLSNMREIKARNKKILDEIIFFSCKKKAEIVIDDEKEQGRRALLNLGHTFGHAIERVTSYQSYLHGEAISVGMLMAMNLSISKDLLSRAVARNYQDIMSGLGLPRLVSENSAASEVVNVGSILKAMKLDKKNTSDKYRLVLPQDEGCILIEESNLALLSQAIRQQL